MSQLNWQPSDGGEKPLPCPFCGKQPTEFYCIVAKRMNYRCETHTNFTWIEEWNTRALSSASTIDVEACAKELLKRARFNNACCVPVAQTEKELGEIILSHLQPASESAWIQPNEWLKDKSNLDRDYLAYHEGTDAITFHDVQPKPNLKRLYPGPITLVQPLPQTPAKESK